MTERIYYEDAFCREFTAKVLACRAVPEGYEVVLDRTAFYPEGGGQSGDRGWLDIPAGDGKKLRIEIKDTAERGDEIFHLCKDPVRDGVVIRGIIDWEFRFDQMQNHSGEHIVSGLIHRRFGYHNVGFHMGSDCITIDFDGMVTMDDLREIEEQANRVVWNDVPVLAENYDSETAKSIQYRSKKEIPGDIRIVTIPDADVCACCGTHVTHTGQIGIILILSCVKFKGGVRIEMLCGRRGLDYLRHIRTQNHEISVMLSARPFETAAAVSHLKAQAEAGASKIYAMKLKRIEEQAQQMTGLGNVVFMCKEAEPDHLRRLADAVMHTCGGICCAFSGDDEHGYKYAAGKPDTDLSVFFARLKTALNGRGGGRKFFIQGSADCTKEQIRSFFEQEQDSWTINEE